MLGSVLAANEILLFSKRPLMSATGFPKVSEFYSAFSCPVYMQFVMMQTENKPVYCQSTRTNNGPQPCFSKQVFLTFSILL